MQGRQMECLDSSLFTLRPGCQIDAKQQLAPRPQLDNRKISNSFHNISKSKFITRQSSEESHHSGPFRETSSLAPTMADAIKAYCDKDVRKALKLLKELYKVRQSAELAYYIGSCLMKQEKHQASIMYLNICLMDRPEYHANAYLYIAINFRLLGNIRSSIKILEDGLRLFPVFEEGLFYKGKLHCKLKEYQEAKLCLERCHSLNPANSLTSIQLADCLRALGDSYQAIAYYDRIAAKDSLHLLAATRKIGLLVQVSRVEQADELLNSLLKKGQGASQLHYFKGLTSYLLGDRLTAVVYLEIGTEDEKYRVKSFRLLMRIAVEECDFFEALHLLNRAGQAKVPEHKIIDWKWLIEGVNEMIKKKFLAALEQLQKAVDFCNKTVQCGKLTEQVQSLMRLLFPHYGYCLYSQNRLHEAIDVFQATEDACAKSQPPKDSSDSTYNRLICQGISLSRDEKFDKATSMFDKAFELKHKSQAVFMSCINLVQKCKQSTEGEREQILQQVLSRLHKSESKAATKSLMYFYESLVYLCLGRPNLQSISKAIESSDEPISEYYFIQALVHSNLDEPEKGLDSITKAIQIDGNILEFYKERSKYYCLVGEYILAIDDCLKCSSLSEEDEEVTLLLTFYYYLDGQYEECYQQLGKVVADSEEARFKEFQQALNLRLSNNAEAGMVGQLIASLEEEELGLQEDYLQVLEKMVEDRTQYAQISVYYLHLLLAAYYCRYDTNKALNHLFGCLEEIQLVIDEREAAEKRKGRPLGKYSSKLPSAETEMMLNEVKYNIVIVSLMREGGNTLGKAQLEQSEKFIRVFLSETNNGDLKSALLSILNIITSESVQSLQLTPFSSYAKLSNRFPLVRIPVKNSTLIANLVVFYPTKLRFSIAPEFDKLYLFNFDLDKVDHRLILPWIRTRNQLMSFTGQILNESITLSETEPSHRQETEEQDDQLVRAIDIRQEFKLDRRIQQKLKKIIGDN